MEKKIKLKVKRIQEALKSWSPHGLCEGTLVQENGVKAKTEACAIGCLSLDFAYSEEGKKFFKENHTTVKKFVKDELYGVAFIRGDFAVALRDYYGLTPETEDAIMGYNDSCVDSEGRADLMKYQKLPTQLRKTIYDLRKRYEQWALKKAETEE